MISKDISTHHSLQTQLIRYLRNFVTWSVLLVASTAAFAQTLTGKLCGSTPVDCRLLPYAVEFLNTNSASGAYFFTACADEVALLDATSDFRRTGQSFPVGALGSGKTGIRRYYGEPTGKANRHFQTVTVHEAQGLDQLTNSLPSRWDKFCYEGDGIGSAVAPLVFPTTLDGTPPSLATVLAQASCPAGTMPVWRVLNGVKNSVAKPNAVPTHRYLSSFAEKSRLIALNDSSDPRISSVNDWDDEGVRLCVPAAEAALRLSLQSIAPVSGVPSDMIVTWRVDRADSGATAIVPQISLALADGLSFVQAESNTTCLPPSATTPLRCSGTSLTVGSTALAVRLRLADPAKSYQVKAQAIDGTLLDTSATAQRKLQRDHQQEPQQCTAAERPHIGCSLASLSFEDDRKRLALLVIGGTPAAAIDSSNVRLTGLTLSTEAVTAGNLTLFIEQSTSGGPWTAVASTRFDSPTNPNNTLTKSSGVVQVNAVLPVSSLPPGANVALRLCVMMNSLSDLFAGSCAAQISADGNKKSASVSITTPGVSTSLTVDSPSTSASTTNLPRVSFIARITGETPVNQGTCSVQSNRVEVSYVCDQVNLQQNRVATCTCTAPNTTLPNGTQVSLNLGASVLLASSGSLVATPVPLNVNVSGTTPPSGSFTQVTWSNVSATRAADNSVQVTGTLTNGNASAVAASIYVRRGTIRLLPQGTTAPANLTSANLTAGSATPVSIQFSASEIGTASAIALCAVQPGFTQAEDGLCPADDSANTQSSTGVRSAVVSVPAANITTDWEALIGTPSNDVSGVVKPQSPTSLDFRLTPNVGSNTSALRARCNRVTAQGSGASCKFEIIETTATGDVSVEVSTSTAFKAASGTNLDFYLQVANTDGDVYICDGVPATTCVQLKSQQSGQDLGARKLNKVRVSVLTEPSGSPSNNNMQEIAITRAAPDWSARIVATDTSDSDSSPPAPALDLRNQTVGAATNYRIRCRAPNGTQATNTNKCTVRFVLDGSGPIDWPTSAPLTFVYSDVPSETSNQFHIRLLASGLVDVCKGVASAQPCDPLISGATAQGIALATIEAKVVSASNQELVDANFGNNSASVTVLRPKPDWVAEIVPVIFDANGVATGVGAAQTSISGLSLATSQVGATYAIRCYQQMPRGANTTPTSCSATFRVVTPTADQPWPSSQTLSAISPTIDANGVPPPSNYFYLRGAAGGKLSLCRGKAPSSGGACNDAATVSGTQDLELSQISATVTPPDSSDTTNNTASAAIERAAGGRGCTDDTSVPIIDEIDFSSPRSWEKFFEMSTVGGPASAVPNTYALRLRVGTNGGNWRNSGSINIFPYSGYSDVFTTLSRCRGRFGAGGLVAGYRDPQGNPIYQSDAAYRWDVNRATPAEPGVPNYAVLKGAGTVDTDGWVSDGIYYINLQQVICQSPSGVCGRRGSASAGVP